MRRRKTGFRSGFALLEAMIIVMVFLVLSAALMASAGVLYRKSLRQAERKAAYCGALTAVRMMAAQILETEGSEDRMDGTDLSDLTDRRMTAKRLMDPPGLAETETSLTAELPDGTRQAMTVFISSERDGDSLVLKARAVSGSQEETVTLRLEKRQSLIPEYPFGSGLLGNVEIRGDSTVCMGPDTDLYLKGVENPEGHRWIRDVWGNLLADGTGLVLDEVRVGGMIISNDTVDLNRCVVGNGGSRRMGGITVSQSLSMTDCDVYGDVYAEQAYVLGDCRITGTVFCTECAGSEETVWNGEGEASSVSGDTWSLGEMTLEEKLLLREILPEEDRIFVPQISGDGKLPGMRICRADEGMRISAEDIPGIQQRMENPENPDAENCRVKDLVFLEKGAELSITEGSWPLYVYGEGTVYIKGNVTIYGGIQAERVVLQDAGLEIRRGIPVCEEALPPVSAACYSGWVPVGYGGDS